LFLELLFQIPLKVRSEPDFEQWVTSPAEKKGKK
jgi:hypothetical protein